MKAVEQMSEAMAMCSEVQKSFLLGLTLGKAGYVLRVSDDAVDCLVVDVPAGLHLALEESKERWIASHSYLEQAMRSNPDSRNMPLWLGINKKLCEESSGIVRA